MRSNIYFVPCAGISILNTITHFVSYYTGINKSINNNSVVAITNSVSKLFLFLTKNLNDASSRNNVILKDGHKNPIRILVSKLGLDGHARGSLVICRALRDAGMEAIYSGLFWTPEQVAKMAVDERVDVVAMSLLNGAHLQFFPKVKSLVNKQEVKNIVAIGVGIIPQEYKIILEKHGIWI